MNLVSDIYNDIILREVEIAVGGMIAYDIIKEV